MSFHEWIERGSISEKLAKQRGCVELVRCKDCKHRGIMAGKTSFDIQWPDDDCLCRSADPYYSWLPPDDWYCANGEREVKNDV